MQELDLETVKRRSVTGVIALTSRTALVQIISFLGLFLLTIFLDPKIFGIFFVVSAVVAILGYFSDIGLAAALIQKKEPLTKEDLKSTFTIQQILVLTLVVVAMVFSNWVGKFYHLESPGLWLFRALVISFFLSSLKTIPSVILERKLDFNRLVIPQIGETIFYNLVAVVLAWKGFGITSFTWAVLGRGITGLALIYLLAPWRPALGISRQSARRLLSFGVPFQMNSFLALIKDDLLIIFLGKVLPMSFVGYIGWAKKWAEIPLRLIMDNVIRVTFPAYARLQESPSELSKGINKAIFFISLFIFPMLVGLSFFIHPLIYLLPKYIKWEPALFSFYLFAFSSALASISTPLTNALAAIGKIKITLILMIMWTALTWILTPVLIFRIGFNGVALTQAIIATTLVVTILVTKRFISFSTLKNISPPLLSTILMSFFLYFALSFFGKGFSGLAIIAFLGSIIYLGTIYIFTGGRIWQEAKTVFLSFKRG